MTHLVFFLEERSAAELIKGLMRKIFPDAVTFQCVPFEGKQDLEKQIGRKLRAWRSPLPCFIVLRDQDSGICFNIKQKLTSICSDAGRPDVLVRIACHQLESWYLGDLRAVELGLQIKGLSSKQMSKKYREPDNLANASDELFLLTEKKYQKVSGSRAISEHLNVDSNRSASFQAFVSGIRKVVNSRRSFHSADA